LHVIVCDGRLMEDAKPHRRRQTGGRLPDNCCLPIISDSLDAGRHVSIVFRIPAYVQALLNVVLSAAHFPH